MQFTLAAGLDGSIASVISHRYAACGIHVQAETENVFSTAYAVSDEQHRYGVSIILVPSTNVCTYLFTYFIYLFTYISNGISGH